MDGSNEVEELKKRMEKIPLVKKVKMPIRRKRKIKFDGEIDCEPKKIIEVIIELFYAKGMPIPIENIINKFGLEKAYRFGERVIQRPLKGIINWGKRGRLNFYFPAAIFLKMENGEIIDPTSIPSFYKTLEEIADKVEINLCKHSPILSEFLRLIGRDKNIAMRKLIEFAKTADVSQCCRGSANYCELIDLIFKKVVDEEFMIEEAPYYRIGDLHLPFARWFGDGELEFTQEDIWCEYSERETLLFPKELQPIMERIINEEKEKSREHGRTYDDNPLYRLVKVKLERPVVAGIKERKQKLILFLGPTSFYPYSALNLSLDKVMLRDRHGKTISLREKYLKGVNLRYAGCLQYLKLPNPLGVALAVVTNDNYILLQRRSSMVCMGPERYTVGAAELMIRGIDVTEKGNPSPFVTAKRCIKDELRINIKEEDVKFLIFGMRLDYLQPQLLGIVKLCMNADEAIKIAESARDRWEGNIFKVEFSINALKNYLLLEETKMSTTAKLTIIFALINKYGFEEIDKELRFFEG